MNPQTESTFDFLFKMLRGKRSQKFWDDQDHDHIITSCITWENSVAMSMLLARQYRPAYTQCVIGKVLTKKVQFQTFKKPSMIMLWKISIKNLLKFHFFFSDSEHSCMVRCTRSSKFNHLEIGGLHSSSLWAFENAFTRQFFIRLNSSLSNQVM